MIKKIILCCLMIGLLTGCGTEGVLRYAYMSDSARIDTAEQFQEMAAELPREDSGKWSYRLDNIKKIVQLFTQIEKICDEKKIPILVESADEKTASPKKWLQNAQKGMDPKKEKMRELSASITFTSEQEEKEFCNRMAALGLKELQNCKGAYWNIMTKQGYKISSDYDEEKESDYEIEIRVPDIMAFGPERYFELADTFLANQLYVNKVICCGGAVDGIVLEQEYEADIVAFLKDQKIQELYIKSSYEEDKDKDFFPDKVKNKAAALLTTLTGNRSDSLSLVKELKLNGKAKGELGDFHWKREIYWDSYTLHLWS